MPLEQFPYTNFHELNLDWMIQAVKDVKDNIDTTAENAAIATEQANIATEQAAIATAAASKIKYINVKDYGAVGDGLTDDSDAIIDALLANNTEKTIVYFPTGTYIISKPIRVYSETVLYFDNATVKVFRNNNDFRQLSFCLGEYNNASFASAYDGVHDVQFINLKFDGGYNALYTTTNNGGGNIGLNHCKNILFRNCEFYNMVNDHYIDVAGSQNVLINNCIFHDTVVLGSGVYEAVNIDWSSNTGFPHFGSWDNTPCLDVIINDSKFYNLKQTSAGIGSHFMPTGADAHRRVKIINNNFHDMSRVIRLINAFDSIITGNNMANCADFDISEAEKFAVWLNYCSGSLFTNNVCRDFIYGVIKVENFGGSDTFMATAIQVNDNIMNVVNTSLSGTAIRIRKVQGFQMNNNVIRRAGRMALNLSDAEDVEVCNNNFPDSATSIDTDIMLNGNLTRFKIILNQTNATGKNMCTLYGTNTDGLRQDNYSATFTAI